MLGPCGWDLTVDNFQILVEREPGLVCVSAGTSLCEERRLASEGRDRSVAVSIRKGKSRCVRCKADANTSVGRLFGVARVGCSVVFGSIVLCSCDTAQRVACSAVFRPPIDLYIQ